MIPKTARRTITRDGQRRLLACEVLHANMAIRNLIREMQIQQIYSVLQTGRGVGMMTMNDSLYRLCREMEIDPEVAVSRSPRPKELLKLLHERPAHLKGGTL